MKIKLISLFRILNLIGCIFLVFSLFLEWYSIRVYTLDSELIASWTYYLFSGWTTYFSEGSTFNEQMRPEALMIPLVVSVLLIIGVILAGYVILFKNIENAAQIRSYYKFAYLLAFLVILVFFFAFISPIMYLVPEDLYFPLYTIIDHNLGYMFSYASGIGYVLQLLSFPFLFPYCLFYFSTIFTFIQQERTPERQVKEIISKAQEEIDLDKMIAEEELKQQIKVANK
ncbi:MAG: hypothetical protein ACFE9Z_04980 [Promethearchaeota archaeon]